MAKRITKNLTYLTTNLTNLLPVMIHLMEHDLLNQIEKEIIEAEKYNYAQVVKLFDIIQKKELNKNFVTILNVFKATGNKHLAERLECSQRQADDNENLFSARSESLGISKWWPEEKKLVNSFYERKHNGLLIVQELHNLLQSSDSKTTVISQKVAVSGLGGVGKTTSAKWFAQHYAEDYEYIIWIDCGEETLSPSLKKLARDLNIKNRDEYDLQELAKHIFEKLKDFSCLLIYDNAECYTGKAGIKDVLPNNPKFHSIITSRNTHWGNKGGFGKINSFQMDVFDPYDSLLFLKQHLDRKTNDVQLKELSILLGHLPLALHIAVATCNDGISIQNYIRRIKNTEEIVNSPYILDDYEKSINKTMQISLDVISRTDNGEIAFKVLYDFGYIRPDHIQLDFFSVIERVSLEEIESAVDLLVKHSLITRTGFLEYSEDDEDDSDAGSDCENNSTASSLNELNDVDWFNGEFDDAGLEDLDAKPSTKLKKSQLISIHRLLQQVIRFNGRASEKETLQNILSCKGFLENKLIPYNHAEKHSDVVEKFTDIRRQLIDQIKLRVLIKEKRYNEAVHLSKLIHSTFRKEKRGLASMYNYAVCLHKNGEVAEALSVFLKLNQNKNLHSSGTLIGKLDIIELDEIPNKFAVVIWCIHLQRKNTRDHRLLAALTKLDRIYLQEEPFEVDPCVFIQIPRIHFTNCKIKFQRSGSTVFEDNFRAKHLEIDSVSIIDNDGNQIDKINFDEMVYSQFPVTTLHIRNELPCSLTSSFVCVDASKLVHSIETVYLNGVELKCTGVNTSTKVLHIVNVTNFEETNFCVSKFENLVKLTIFQTDDKFVLDFASLPKSVKYLFLFDIKKNLDNPPLSTHLQLKTLSLKSYIVEKIENIIKIVHTIKSELLIFRLWSKRSTIDVMTHANKIKQLFTMCENSTVVLGGPCWADMDYKTHLDLEKYNIRENSDYYQINRKTNVGKTISLIEFNKISGQTW